MQRGSLRLDHRTWRLKIRRRDVDGRRRFQWVRLGTVDEIPTRTAARRAADRYLERLHPRALNAGTTLDWSVWCDRYIDQTLAMQASGTRNTQGSIINQHLRHAFSGAVHEIGPEQVRAFIVEQHKAGVAATTIAARFAVLRRMLRQAEAEGLAARPPTARSVKLPKVEQENAIVKSRAFTDEECERIFAAATVEDRTAFMLARYLGLRGSEVLGLTWPLIDLQAGAVTVRQQALDGEARKLKTRGSHAVLQAPAVLLEQLQAYRETWTPRAEGSEFLFEDATGRPMESQELRERLYVLLDALGIRRRGLHGFRHACALAMASAGCNPEVIRRAMRHSSLRVTAIYLSAAPEDIAAGLAKGAATRGRNEAGRAAAAASIPGQSPSTVYPLADKVP